MREGDIDASGEGAPDQAYRELFLARTQILLGKEDLAVLKDKCVLVAGCGGVGGITLVTLARLGVGRFLLPDPSCFDAPDVNRQYAATRATLGRNKAAVYQDLLHEIDPSISVQIYQDGVTEDNLEELLSAADLVIDALDYVLPLSLRLRFYRRARETGRYCISSPILGFGTMMLVAAPGGMGMEPLIERFVQVGSTSPKLPGGFGDLFFPQHVAKFEQHVASAIPSCSIATCFSAGAQCTEAALILLGDRHPDWRAPICLPQILVLEPLRPTYRVVHYTDLFTDLDDLDPAR